MNINNCVFFFQKLLFPEDMMLDEDWESAMGELEVAAASSDGFLPAAYMQGFLALLSQGQYIWVLNKTRGSS